MTHDHHERVLNRLVRQGDWIVDGGAGHGVVTKRVAQLVGPTGHVLAVEPHHDNTLVVQRVATAWVTVTECALSDEDGRALFYSSAGASLTGSLVKANVDDQNRQVSAKTQRLDTLIADWRRLDGIKLDLQGGEPKALAGAEQALTRWHPWLLLEIWPKGLANAGSSVDALVAWLEAHGYRRDPTVGEAVPGKRKTYTDWLWLAT